MARREERAYREYVSDEQRSQPGCPARELCDESLLRDTRKSRRCDARLKPSRDAQLECRRKTTFNAERASFDKLRMSAHGEPVEPCGFRGFCVVRDVFTP